MRNKKVEQAYQAKLKTLKTDYCFMCDHSSHNKVIMQTAYWRMFECDYPYENTEKHHLLTPIRHVRSLIELKRIERNDLFDILNNYENEYDKIIKNLNKNQSLPEHVHFHLIKNV